MTAMILWVVGAIVVAFGAEVAYRYARKRWLEPQLSLKFPKVRTPDTDYYGGRVEMIQAPSVGRRVHYYGFLPAMNGNGDDTTDQGPFMADVLDVTGDAKKGHTTLLVHNRNGAAWVRYMVPLADSQDEKQTEWWEWPPRV